MQKYDSYKDSGVQWLGEIPSHWETMPLKHMGVFTKGKISKNTNCDAIGLPIIGASEMNGYEPTVFSDDKFIPQCSERDILILWDGANAGLVSTGHNGIVSSTVVKFECKSDLIKSNYLYYLEKNYQRYYKEKVGGTTIPHMNSEYINDCPTLLPPLPEQEAMVSYLDKATAEIDEAISQQQKMIDLLNERKQIIINNAVTKGLNPNAKMKDSGVEWIGEIPEGWEVRKLKTVMSIQRGHDLTAEQFVNGNIPVYGSGGLMGYHNQFSSLGPSIIIGRSGSVGKLQFIKDDIFWAHNTTIYLTDNKGNNIKYLFYLLSSIEIKVLATQTAVPTLDRKNVLDYRCPIAIDCNEQQKIVKYLDSQLLQIDSAISNINKTIDLLKERKQILINEVVTGKVKVG